MKINTAKTEQLDSFEKAQQEQDEKTERGKNLITDIAMSCSNDFTVIDSLMEILELFSIKDSSVMIGDMVNDLQQHLFIWTNEYGNAVDAWKDSVLYGTKYKDTPGESLKPGDTAKQVSDLLNNPNLPGPIKDGLADGLLDLFNSHISQSEFRDYEKSPEYVEKILRGYEARQQDE